SSGSLARPLPSLPWHDPQPRQHVVCRARNVVKRLNNRGACLAQPPDLALVRPALALNNRTRVAEARATARAPPANVGDHGFGQRARVDQVRDPFLLRGADLTK